MDRLERDYENEAERYGVRLKVFYKGKNGMTSRLKSVGTVVVFTGKTSRRLKNEAMSVAKSQGIPLTLAQFCGICAFRQCIGCLIGQHIESNQSCIIPVSTTFNRMGGAEKAITR